MAAVRRLTGCLLAGAMGDALGAPVEFMTLAGSATSTARPV